MVAAMPFAVVASSLIVAFLAVGYIQWRERRRTALNNSTIPSKRPFPNAAQTRRPPADHAIYVIGDVHADVHCTKYWVDRTGLVVQDGDNKLQWTDPSSTLIFMGDYLDKGRTSKATVQYVQSLTRAFPDQVVALLGNHELEALLDRDPSWRPWGITPDVPDAAFHQLMYGAMHPGDYLAYLSDDEYDADVDEQVVKLLYDASAEIVAKGKVQGTYMHPLVDSDDSSSPSSVLHYIPQDWRRVVQQRLQVYQQSYLASIASTSDMGKWLEHRPILHLQNETMFVHGGIPARWVIQLQKQQQTAAAAAHGYHQHKAASIDTPALVKHINAVLREHAHDMATFVRNNTNGRLMYELATHRGNHQQDCQALQRDVLQPLGVHALVVGHTPSSRVRVTACRADNQVAKSPSLIAADASLGRWFRNSGNYYCPGDRAIGSHCSVMDTRCQGQIVKILPGHQVELIEAGA